MRNKKRNREKTARKTIWKWLFLLLLAINIGGAAFIASRILTPRDQTALNSVKPAAEDKKVATVNTSTEQLNQLINRYLAAYQSKDMNYRFYLSNQAVLEASYKLFGQTVPLYIYFEPLALSDGSVSLQVQSVSAGSLNLPTATILDYVKESVKLPDFVQVESAKNQIVINLPKLVLADNLYVKANQIDLANGKYTFDLMLKA